MADPASAPRSIRTRILAAFVLSLAAFSGALGHGLFQLQAIGEGLVAINTGYLPLAGVAADLQAVVRQMDRDLDRLARESPRPLAGHRANAAFYSASLADDVARGEVTARGAQAALTDPVERQALSAVLEALAAVEVHRLEFDESVAGWLEAEASEDPTRTAASLADVDRHRKALGVQISQLAALIEGRIQAVSERTARAQTRASTVGGALAALAIALAGALAGVALLTLRPIDRLTAQVQRLAAGDYAGRVDVRSNDEIGLLAREFNAMAEAVHERDRRLSERAAALDRLSLRLRQVLDAIRAGLVVVDPDDAGPETVAMANPAALALWGASEGGPLPGALGPLAPSPDADRALPRRYEALPVGERIFDIDVVPFGPRGALVVGEDVTDRNRDRERLARSERLALVGQMLAQITHEVRNPLNAMSLNAELLAEDIDDPEARAMLSTITGEIRRLEAVTARYLDLSRRRQPDISAADPLTLAREVVRLEEEALRRAGVTTTVEGSGGVVDLDADALRRALRNVVRNAVEAEATHIGVTVGVGEDDVTITVTDDGPGMDMATARRAFEPFYTTKARGTGLGLAISRAELEDVRGSLRCASQPGAGTTFTLTVPVSCEPSDAEDLDLEPPTDEGDARGGPQA